MARLKHYTKQLLTFLLGERGKAYVSMQLQKLEAVLLARPGSLLGIRLQSTLPQQFKIGMAVLAHDRSEYLELCLESLFKTKLHNYDITFLLQDDGSTDPEVREIIDRPRDPRYKIVRFYSPKGHDSWGAAFNKAMQKLLELDDFDILGSCDSDALFHPEWLDQTMKICLWAKEHHGDHILGPFSSFNSSDYEFHRILGTYASPYGSYVVKYRMGALNYFYFKRDLLKLGFYAEDKNDETLMTEKFNRHYVRNYSTETSYVEHIGAVSVLNKWRPTPVRAPVYGINLAESGWGDELEKADTLGFYKYVKRNSSFGDNVRSETPLDILIPAIEKDMPALPYVVEGARKYIRHPIGSIFILAPELSSIKSFCEKNNCAFVPENTVAPIQKKDVHYVPRGLDRSGWLLQQFMKLSGDKISSHDYFLALDADTVLMCPQVFLIDGQTILLHSDEHHHPYFELFFKLFGVPTRTPLSFVAHQMLFNRNRLRELRNAIAIRHNKAWHEAIMSKMDATQSSAFSEFETYGHWMHNNYPGEIKREYWFNTSVSKRHLGSDIWSCNRGPCRSISFHSYTE